MADQMGLGKTLQMIALIASDVDKITPTSPIAWKKGEMASTLVVVPFPCGYFSTKASRAPLTSPNSIRDLERSIETVRIHIPDRRQFY
jgi:SNF2-related domain